jgi:hypothetical protein
MAQTIEVFAVHRGAGLDFNAGDLAQTVLQDEINLDIGLRAVGLAPTLSLGWRSDGG